MKKGFATLLVLLALFAAAETAAAQTCRRRVTLRRTYSRDYSPRYARVYYPSYARVYRPRYARARYGRSRRAYDDRRIVYYARNRRGLW